MFVLFLPNVGSSEVHERDREYKYDIFFMYVHFSIYLYVLGMLHTNVFKVRNASASQHRETKFLQAWEKTNLYQLKAMQTEN